MWKPGEHLAYLAPRQSYHKRKRVFLGSKTNTPLQKAKAPDLKTQLTEEPQKWSLTVVRGCPGH